MDVRPLPPMDKVREYLYIGDYDDGKLEEMPEEVSFVISLMGGGFKDQTDIWYPLTDGGNEKERFYGAVENVLKAIKDGENVLVHCAMGQSRSGSVVATVLAVEEDMTYTEALEEVKEIRPIVNPVPQLNNLGRSYIQDWNGSFEE